MFIINRPSRKFGKKSMAVLKNCNNCSLFDSLIANIYAGNFKNNYEINKKDIPLLHKWMKNLVEMLRTGFKEKQYIIEDLINPGDM